MTPPHRLHRRDLQFYLLYAFLLILLATLRPLALPDEGRYGDVGRWMLRSGDWLTPRLDGLPFFHKPPLLYWLEAAFMQVFGVHAWVARLVPALHAGLLVLVTQLYTMRFHGQGLARRVALILASSMLILGGGDYINCDMVVACWIGVCIMSFAWALQSSGAETLRLGRWGFVAAALGLLAKGLIGIALPGLVLLIWVATEQRWRDLLRLPWVSGIFLALVIALPWFIALEHIYGGFFHYFFVEQQFTRYVGSSFNNRQPLPFYVVCLALGFFPFSTLLRWKMPAATPALRPDIRLAWIWLLSILIFFSIPVSKLVGYILPVLPALALLTAIAWPSASGERATRVLYLLGALIWACALLAVSVQVQGMPVVGLSLRIVSALLALLWLAGPLLHRHGHGQALLRLWALQSGLTLFLVAALVAARADDKGSQLLAAVLLHQHQHEHVLSYRVFPFDLPFYLDSRRPIPILGDWRARQAFYKDDGDQQLLDGLAFTRQGGGVLAERDSLPQWAQRWPQAWLVSPAEADDALLRACARRFGRYGRYELWQLRAAADQAACRTSAAVLR